MAEPTFFNSLMGRQRIRRNKSRQDDQINDTEGDPLYTILPRVGLQVISVESDGNCLFRSFAGQYSGDEERHEEFRTSCCEYMLTDDPEFFTAFLDDQSLIDYVSEMRQDGTWGTQMEIVALCKRYSVNCVIFRPDGLHYRIECDDTDEADTRVLMISHHDEQHFNEVRFKERSRVLTSFNELELLLTELEEAPARLSKKELRKQRKSAAPQIVSSPNGLHKIIDL